MRYEDFPRHEHVWQAGGTVRRLHSFGIGRRPRVDHLRPELRGSSRDAAAGFEGGQNTVRFSGATAHVEPDSVIVRDPAGRRAVQVVEQNYRNDPVSQERLLNLYEGKTIEFAVRNPDGTTRTISGKIVRSGYVPHYEAMNRYGAQYQANQMAMASPAGGTGQPIIEVGGKLQFSLPGQPIFPALSDDTILKPAFDWILYSGQPARFDAELSYVSGGMSWR